MLYQQVGFATVDAVSVRREGIFFDLTGQPLGEDLKGYLATECGDDYGTYIPYDIDDTVLYVCPSGNPGSGVCVIGRFFEAAERVPQQIVDAAETSEQWVAKSERQLVLQTAKGALRLNVRTDGGASEVKIAPDGTISAVPVDGKRVKLGSEQDAQLDFVALYTQLKAEFDAFVSKYNAHVHLAGTLANGAGPVTGAVAQTLSQANNLTNAVASSNVVAKKP